MLPIVATFPLTSQLTETDKTSVSAVVRLEAPRNEPGRGCESPTKRSQFFAGSPTSDCPTGSGGLPNGSSLIYRTKNWLGQEHMICGKRCSRFGSRLSAEQIPELRQIWPRAAGLALKGRLIALDDFPQGGSRYRIAPFVIFSG
jgi:hypothetical protein